MYIEASSTNLPGYKAEHLVWKAVKDTFKDTAIGIQHFPLFDKNEGIHREIDILLVSRELGITAIEVKGININQITQITGYEWHYRNFYTEKGTPYQQVRNQMYMLQNFLEEDPLLYNRFSRRALLALPYITSLEWNNKGFGNEINIPPIIFKDDLNDTQKIQEKINNNYLWQYRRKMSDIQWNQLLFKLGITSKERIEDKQQHFSALYVINTMNEFTRYISQIADELRNGFKIYILSYTHLNEVDFELLNAELPTDISSYVNGFQFLYYECSHSKKPLRSRVDYDGINVVKDNNLQQSIKNDFPKFNIGQYIAIHTPLDTSEIITAGAGTGKTHVMVDRVMFLLLCQNINLSSIDMITFTNESTNEMKDRLEKRLILLYSLTNKAKFLFYAEDVTEMKISTIHKYGKSLLKRLAHEIGYGQNLSVSSFTMEKKLIIEKLLNRYLIDERLAYFINTKIPLYKLIDFTVKMWNRMEVKGLSQKEIEDLDWGLPSTTNHILQDIFKDIFRKCEKELEVIKKKRNSISTGDLIRKLKQFTDDSVLQELERNRFIFIDEFQDSDSVQIELFASLANNLNYKLFIVGDIKQSIYRFRGADYKSFNILKDLIKELNIVEISLNQNYRSSSDLLDEMHNVFEKWGAKGLLEYNPIEDRLLGQNASKYPKCIHPIYDDIPYSIKTALSQTSNKSDKIALIVRTNKQAREIKKICDNNGLTTSENLDGTFYTSDAVRHFNILLKALLFPREPKFLIDLLETPYFGYVIPYQKLVEFNGSKEEILKFVKSVTNNTFNKYVKKLPFTSPLAVFHEIVNENQLFNNVITFYTGKLQGNEEEVKYQANKYELNLQYLITQIEQKFNSRNCELHAIEQWLMIQIKTNRTENEPIIKNQPTQIEITTVHRSKGLQYHSVIIPYTNLTFNRLNSDYHFQEEPDLGQSNLDVRRIGWKINNNKNSHYDDLNKKDQKEIEKEEARLLYVAMTRAIDQLYVVHKNTKSSNSWLGLLKKGGINFECTSTNVF